MVKPEETSIRDFTYDLPLHKIALQPLPVRDDSKLLVWRNGNMKDAQFRHLADEVPAGGLFIFNDTRVINARLLFEKITGSTIEIFCLEPVEYSYSEIMFRSSPVRWNCMIGGISKWKSGALVKRLTIDNNQIELTATLIEREDDTYTIEFSWQPYDILFESIIEAAGNVPLPPYIKRELIKEDNERYQTVYAKQQGSVAAPTAGLHFTAHVLSSLADKGINSLHVTLHVSAGTFRPVKADLMRDHSMHAEWISVKKEVIMTLADTEQHITAVGTTSARTLETLYWLGIKVSDNPQLPLLNLEQWDCYKLNGDLSKKNSLEALIAWMESNKTEALYCPTKLLIVPGYNFKVVNSLVTNFHQPQSTLLLLVAAAAGDNWKKAYDHALQHDYRFLSYGDSNLIFIDQG